MAGKGKEAVLRVELREIIPSYRHEAATKWVLGVIQQRLGVEVPPTAVAFGGSRVTVRVMKSKDLDESTQRDLATLIWATPLYLKLMEPTLRHLEAVVAAAEGHD